MHFSILSWACITSEFTTAYNFVYIRSIQGSGHHIRVRGGRRKDPQRGTGEVRGRHHGAARRDRPLHLHRGPIIGCVFLCLHAIDDGAVLKSLVLSHAKAISSVKFQLGTKNSPNILFMIPFFLLNSELNIGIFLKGINSSWLLLEKRLMLTVIVLKYCNRKWKSYLFINLLFFLLAFFVIKTFLIICFWPK